jgi:hypothetical protein
MPFPASGYVCRSMNPLGGAGNSGIASYGSEPGRPCNDGPPLRSVVAEPRDPPAAPADFAGADEVIMTKLS